MNIFANLARGLFGEINEPYEPFDPNGYEHLEGSQWRNVEKNFTYTFKGVLCTSEDYYWVLEFTTGPYHDEVVCLPVSLNIERYGYERIL